MSISLTNWLDSFLPAKLTQDQDSIRRHRLFIIINFLITVFAISYGVLSYFIHFKVGMNAMIVSAIFFFLQPYLLRSGIHLNIMGVVFGIYSFLLNTVLVYYSGGLFISPVTPFIILTPPVVLIFTNYKTASVFAVLCVLYVIGFAIVKQRIKVFPFTYEPTFHLMFLTLALAGLVIIFFLITNTFENTKNFALRRLVEKQNELEAEQKRSDRLLLNILPEETAKELKSFGIAKPKRHENVTVMFTDFVEFTKQSENIPADELVSDIDFYFREFDEIISKYNIEKIKTIGDSYMCVAGLNGNDGDEHAVNMIHAAFDIMHFIEKTKLERTKRQKPYFNIRIGINSGAVVAGVVGSKKFAYDIWGDSVNVAARLQQSSEPGRINISNSTYLQTKDQFVFTSRGKIAIKNRGELEMYFVDSVLA